MAPARWKPVQLPSSPPRLLWPPLQPRTTLDLCSPSPPLHSQGWLSLSPRLPATVGLEGTESPLLQQRNRLLLLMQYDLAQGGCLRIPRCQQLAHRFLFTQALRTSYPLSYATKMARPQMISTRKSTRMSMMAMRRMRKMRKMRMRLASGTSMNTLRTTPAVLPHLRPVAPHQCQVVTLQPRPQGSANQLEQESARICSKCPARLSTRLALPAPRAQMASRLTSQQRHLSPLPWHPHPRV